MLHIIIYFWGDILKIIDFWVIFWRFYVLEIIYLGGDILEIILLG